MAATFFYPSMNVGGAQLLFFRMAEALYLLGEQIKIVDFEEGFVPNELRRQNIPFELLPWSIRQTDLTLDKEDVLVIPLSGIHDVLTTFRRCSPRLLFWSIHPNNINAWLPLRSLTRRIPTWLRPGLLNNIFNGRFDKLSKAFPYLAQSDSIFFMDYPNAESARSMRLLRSDQIRYLPIPITNIESITPNTRQHSPSGHFDLGYIGRMDRDKINAAFLAVDIAHFLSKSLPKMLFRLHLIGDGSENTRIRDYTKDRPFQIVHHGTISFNSLPDFISKGVDLGLGIGTAALEFGNIAKPTILLDCAATRINLSQFQYAWLHETKYFTLQASFGKDTSENNNLRPLTSLADEITNATKLQELGKLAKAYVSKNHSIHNVARRFKELIRVTSADLSTLRAILK